MFGPILVSFDIAAVDRSKSLALNRRAIDSMMSFARSIISVSGVSLQIHQWASINQRDYP
jgi:hypothetical protein